MAKLGPKAFEQCAGFLRIQGGKNPLDATSVHPESYEAARKLLEKLGYDVADITGAKLSGLSKKITDYPKMAEELGIGEITLRDIVKELEKPGRDPRDEMPKPVLRSDVLDMKDLKPGMILKGTVRNVIDFGAFVDIGVHQDGLVHVSEMSDTRFIKHPLEAVSVGDIVEVKVLEVDQEKKRISLSMRLGNENKKPGAGKTEKAQVQKNTGKQNGNGKPGQDKKQKNHSGNDRKNAQNHGRQNGQNNQNNQNNQNRKKSEPRDGYTLQELMNKWKI